MPELTRKQIYLLRGSLKAPQRAIAMRQRHIKYRSKVVEQYQQKLAKDLLLHLK